MTVGFHCLSAVTLEDRKIEDVDSDVVGIAALIRDENKNAVAAVSVAALAPRTTGAEAESTQKVLATAQECEHDE